MNHRSSRGLLATLSRTLALAAIATAVLAADSPPQAPSGSGDKSPAVAAVPAPPPFGFEQVVERAKEVVAAPYKDPRGSVPDWLLKITYDQWRDIRFRPDRALWRDKPSGFQVQFFHPGLSTTAPSRSTWSTSRASRPFAFSPGQFDYGKNDFASRVPQDLGFAGFRIHYPIKTPDYYDEVIVFLGASYFRAVGKRPGLRALGARARDRHRASRRARSSPTSASSGW